MPGEPGSLWIKVISFSVGGEGPSDGTSLLDEACSRMVEEGWSCASPPGTWPAPSSIVMPGGAKEVITVGH